MTEKKTTSDIVAATGQGGILRNIFNQLKLIFRLMGDKRVSALAKIIPIATFGYLLLPADLAPNVVLPFIGVLDDAAVLWLGSYAFTQFSPPEVVEEHMRALNGVPESSSSGDVVDAESTEIKE